MPRSATRPPAHPLMGCNISTLIKVWREAGALSPGAHTRLAAALGAGIARLPFSLLEQGYVAARSRRAPPAAPPIFILGHWRSGTTHLYNILAKSPDFAYVSPFATGLPWNFLFLGRLFESLIAGHFPKEGRYIDNVGLTADSPQEDEAALANMTPLSFYHGIYFPQSFEKYFNPGIFFEGVDQKGIADWQARLQHLHLKLALRQPGRQLIIKNPVYTARVRHLRTLWPEAKFIHIRRNPFDVFFSSQVFFQRMFAALALQDYAHVDIDEVIFTEYARMMNLLMADTADLPPAQFIELSYEDLQSDPLGEIARIYETLGLKDFAAAAPHFTQYLQSVRGYSKAHYSYPPAALGRIGERWQPYIERGGYSPPTG